MSKKIKPLNNRVLVRRSKPQATKGGIILPDSAQKKPQEGEVVATGPGKMNEDGRQEPMNVKPGDRVLFSSYAGNEVKNKEGDEDLLILSEDDILAIYV